MCVVKQESKSTSKVTTLLRTCKWPLMIVRASQTKEGSSTDINVTNQDVK